MYIPEELAKSGPRIEDDGSLYYGKIYLGSRECDVRLRARDAAIVARNMQAGVQWFAASPMYELPRPVVAYCLANADAILTRYNGGRRG